MSSDIDISFMGYFLEIVRSKGFVIPHSKLVEYGIMTSMRSGDVLKKLTLLDMKENADYRLRHVSQSVK